MTRASEIPAERARAIEVKRRLYAKEASTYDREADLVGERERKVGFEINVPAAWPARDQEGERYVGWVREGWSSCGHTPWASTPTSSPTRTRPASRRYKASGSNGSVT